MIEIFWEQEISFLTCSGKYELDQFGLKKKKKTMNQWDFKRFRAPHIPRGGADGANNANDCAATRYSRCHVHDLQNYEVLTE